MRTHKSLALVTAAFTSVLLCSFVQAQSHLTEGLIAYYPLDGGVNDESGNGYDATNMGGQFVMDRFGLPASAMYLASSVGDEGGGTGQWVQVDIAALPSGNAPRTISVWINFEPRNRWQSVCNYGNSVHAQRFGLLIKPGIFYLVGHDYDFSVNTPLLTTNAWHHLCVSHDGLVSSMYVDTQLVAAPERTFNTVLGVNVCIGKIIGGPGEYFAGMLDDVRFYNRALSSVEVQELYAYESKPRPVVPRRATGIVQVVNGFVVGFNITDPGYGYTNDPAPAVRVKDAEGTGATAHAIVENGRVVRLEIETNGRNYTGNATVVIAPPPFWPSVTIDVSRVKVNMKVVLGRKYRLDSSLDLENWTATGEPCQRRNESGGEQAV